MKKSMHTKTMDKSMKMMSHMPKGGNQSPKGDLGALRQAEARLLGGGFMGTKDVSAAAAFKGRKKK